jgi:outer membrane protein
MRRFLTVLVAGVTVLWAGTATPQSQQPQPGTPSVTRIGFVDVQRVLARSAAGVAAREQLERDKATMQKEIDGKRQELEKLRDELEKKGPLMTADARRDREELMERKRRDAIRMADDFQRELGRKEQILAQKVLQELSGVIDRIGKQKGYYLIVERQRAAVLYFAPEADLTDEIIRAYDQEAAAKGKK